MTDEELKRLCQESRYSTISELIGRLEDWSIHDEDEEMHINSIIHAMRRYVKYLENELDFLDEDE